jgi:type IV pilus assembly protein PilC
MSLTESLKAVGGVPDYAISILKIGEKNGKVEDTCAGLNDYYQKRDELGQSLRSALVYPLIMVFMVFVVVVILLTQAMPVFDQVFNQLGLELTGVAGTLLMIGQILRSSALYITAAIVAIILIIVIIRLTPAGKKLFTKLYEVAPVTRIISFETSLQRFALAMATMSRSGLEADAAIGLAEPLVDNSEARKRVHEIHRKVEKSASLQSAIEESELFSPDEMSVLSVGFKTGSDARAFEQVGESISRSTERKINRLVGTLEPALVAFMCIIVGAVLLSVMLPLLGVLGNI